MNRNNIIDELQEYMLNDTNMTSFLKKKINILKNDKANNKVTDKAGDKNSKIQPSLFFPNQQDSLFWCFYIIKNGEFSYESLHNKNSLISKQMKINFIDVIRKNKDTVKMYKFDTLSNIESNLANDVNLNVKSFLTLCAVENINVIYVSKKTYFELLMNDSNIIYIVNEVESQSKYNNKYGFEMATEDLLHNIRSTKYKLDKIDKPIKSESSYKVQDLLDICSKLAIEINNTNTGKKKTKKELYESIIQYF
jgi:hypothetical protein